MRVITTIIFFGLSISLIFVCSPLVFGEENKKNESEEKKSRLIVLPVIFYSPETKVAGGLGGIYSFRTSNKAQSRPSSIRLGMIYTQKKQVMLEFGPDIYFKNEEYHLKCKINFINFSERFYGIGSSTTKDMREDFTSRITRINLNLKKKLFQKLYIGIQYEREQNEVVKVEEDGQLIRKEILGSEPGKVSGIGFLVNRDARNNIFSPSSGDFCLLSTTLFRNGLGSNYDFTRHRLDLRKYFPLFSSHVLAFQSYFSLITGDPPFQMLSLMGGQNWMRGYYKGRFRDKNMIVLQMEYRMPLLWKFGIVGFLGFGDVANKVDNFVLKDFKYSVGLGIRYMLSCKEKLNVRFDFGFCKESFGVYIAVNEAF
ncbi:MAG: BamA/TamA family outer membrane protein [Candidatus Aminicenantes bacterium]|nr:BamA/TamA family outer membrane protein [Candidatus Aminicenantes bacterium]